MIGKILFITSHVTPGHLVMLEKQKTFLQHENINTNTLSKPRKRNMELETI
jgi:hypothetical protein